MKVPCPRFAYRFRRRRSASVRSDEFGSPVKESGRPSLGFCGSLLLADPAPRASPLKAAGATVEAAIVKTAGK